MNLKNQLHPWLFVICFLLSACAGHPPGQAPALPAPASIQTPEAFVLPAETRRQVTDFLRTRVHQQTVASQDNLSVPGMSLPQGITAFYQYRHYEPAWNDGRSLTQLIAALEDLRFDGLDPFEYSLSELKQKHANLPNMTSFTQRAELDLLASRACITALVHLRMGKLDPYKLESQWNFSSPVLDTQQGLTLLDDAIRQGNLADIFQLARPQQPIYTRMREGLRHLYGIQSAGGWPRIPEGPTLKPGMVDERIIPLRQRLIAAGVLNSDHANGKQFDAALEQAVIQFQREQNLDVDGAVGRQTLAVLNVPVEQRIAQVKANLERGRWLLHEVNGDFVWIDIAGYRIHLYRAGKPVWTSRVQVGKPYRSTPIFKSRISYVTFNPTWTIPPTIFKEDVLPQIRRDPEYLINHRLSVLDGKGNVLDAATIDWQSPGNILLREEAGPLNPLGKVVIRFPNPHAIYMHDTPSKSNFTKGQRAFSSGCIRVERPLELVELLFNDPQRWNRESIENAIATGGTHDVGFSERIPILLTYSTVGITDDGRIAFKQDIYERDPALIAALAHKAP
jgi:murein L,D-transpeptidase YcbB/YkuD